MYKSDVFDPEHILISFYDYQPELLMNSLRTRQQPLSRPGYMPAYNDRWDIDTYRHYVMANADLRRTDDEAIYMAKHFSQRMQHRGEDSGREDSVFEVLRRYSKTMLASNGMEPLCNYKRVLRWRKLTHKLGQDLFTTVFFAAEDVRLNRIHEHFAWPANIQTDNSRLTQIMSQGISENHFHLGGSTRLFTLSWVALMNHPSQIANFLKISKGYFRERLNPGILASPDEKMMSWDELLLYGAFLRALLFRRCRDGDSKQLYDEYFKFDSNISLRTWMNRDLIDVLRHQYGARIPQKDGGRRILDYALSTDMVSCLENDNRLLAGERKLMYECFRRVFDCSFTQNDKDLFYLYLLIKNAFRSELVQVNDRSGFQNFARYQDRKSLFWSKFPEYETESIRLSLNASLSNGFIRSLEARITPSNSPKELLDWIRQNDSSYGFAITGASPRSIPYDDMVDSPVFYVLHFIKHRGEISSLSSQAQQRFSGSAYARNSVVRRTVEHQARVIAQALSKNPYLRKRIRGIDACSNEIGCRPETFATEFRFLRSHIPCTPPPFTEGTDSSVHLSATYHAGEDFIDIVDGLRAIDEAELFLELRRGDRLGHALALGIKPFDYYEQKRWKLVIPKQDLLDNLVWLLQRMPELGLQLPRDLEKKLERYAVELMGDIGYDPSEFSLLDYYHAWWLRGDHPSLYSTLNPCGGQCKTGDIGQGTVVRSTWTQCAKCEYRGYAKSQHFLARLRGGYESYLTLDRKMAKQYRYDYQARRICMDYHFAPEVKEEGAKIATFVIDHRMAALLEQLQNKMQHKLASRGIFIECNPSSNVLIGSFNKYRDHPLFRFNRYGIHVPQWEHESPPDLCISINTDDQGVFDTSLENEYACVALAMEREVDEEGNRVYRNDEIYAYLEHLRVLGNSQTFHYKGDELFFSQAEKYRDYCERLMQSVQKGDSTT